MILVCGPSGVGKTTLSDMLSEYLNIPHLDVDKFYAAFNGDEKDHSNVFDVWMNYFRAIHNKAIRNESVIIDTDALTKSQRDQFIEWFPEFKHILIWISGDLDLCLNNNENRNRKVPRERLINRYNNKEAPLYTDPDWWVYHIINKDNNFMYEIDDKDYVSIEDLFYDIKEEIDD